MGSIYGRIAGANHPATGVPRNVLVLPEAVKDGLVLQSNFETQAMHTLTQPGGLGASYDAFNPSRRDRKKGWRTTNRTIG